MNSETTSEDARLSQDEVQRVYNRIARVYDLWGTLVEARARRRGIELARIQDGEKVLDVAVGTGLMLAEVIRRNPHGMIAGIDISEGMLKKARSKIKDTQSNVDLKQGSALAIPYPASTFDLLTNGYMFDLLPFAAIPQTLAEFKRVLKADGRLVLVNMTEGERLGSGLYQWLYHQSPAAMGGCRGVKLAAPLAQAGFRVVVREYSQQFLFPSEIILANVR